MHGSSSELVHNFHLHPSSRGKRFVYQIVAPKAYIPKALVEVYESGEKVVLPPWDPMVRLSYVFGECATKR